MPLLTLTTAATAYPLATRPARPPNNPTAQWCASVDMQIISVGGVAIITTPSVAKVWFGSPAPLGQSSAVTSSAYDAQMDGTVNPSDTFGLGNDDCNSIDLSLCYLVSDTNNVVVAVNPRTV